MTIQTWDEFQEIIGTDAKSRADYLMCEWLSFYNRANLLFAVLNKYRGEINEYEYDAYLELKNNFKEIEHNLPGIVKIYKISKE